MTSSTNVPATSRNARLWPSITAAMGALAYLLWAGSSYDPRLANFWTNAFPGWTLPAPGLFHFAIAAALLFGALSAIAFRAPASPNAGPRIRLVSIIIILLAAAAAHWLVYLYWRPFPLDPSSLAAHKLPPFVNSWRLAACAANLLTTALLISILHARKASLWPAVLFALHPLVLLDASNGTWMNCLLPLLVFIAATSPRLRPAVRNNLAVWGACLCLVWFSRMPGIAPRTFPFNGLLAQLFDSAGAAPGSERIILWALEVALQAAICWLAIAARWDVARTWGHMILAVAIVSPTILPADVLPLVALLPLAWTRAGWVLSFTVLFVFATPLLWSPGFAWRLSAWITFLMTMPVLVVEIDELAGALRQHFQVSRAIPGAAPAQT